MVKSAVMDISHLLDGLNDAQREAVTAEPGPLLVLAGAGSGKTRVLTHRIAWLVQVLQVSPLSLLAVTFTNKAAAEMRGRVEQMLGFTVAGMWMGTFHGLSHRLLRAHWREAGLPQGFQIIDSDDQLRIVKRVLKNAGLDEAYYPPKRIQWWINGHKEEGRRPKDLGESRDPQAQEFNRLYQAYEELCQRNGLVDFSELMLRAYELLRNNEPVRRHYQERFRHVLVDEFQDTNAIQYRWLRLLAEGHRNLFVVGDDDQSIYGWRGARVENILKFEHDYPGTKVVRLEQNYRSTGTILKAANAVIEHNADRLGKELWTAGNQGEPIRLYTAFNELDEAQFVVERIRRWVEEGNARSEAAILYRSNAQSRVFEERLLNAGIPYRVYGGLRFFERAEIKDALAYLRLIANRDDDPSFDRIANVPTRGLGAKSLDAVRDHARTHNLSLWRAAGEIVERGLLPARAATALAGFLALIDGLDAATRELDLAEQVDHVLGHSSLLDHYRKEKGEKAEARVENLEELVSAARNFDVEPEDGLEGLPAFLAHAALEAGEGQAQNWEDCVQLMSLHSAKGLEFPLVFLTGMEEGLFPHQRSLEEPGRLEEERRLCYVGMTRAMRELYLSHAEVRRLHGRENYAVPSRFLGELPEAVVESVRPRPVITRPAWTDDLEPEEPAVPGMRLGSRVRHAKFGEGVVLNMEGRGEHARIQVNFEDAGSKWLVVAYANLQPV
jgi:DNA helicase-2/ATP-dependent DNA helicase PcrA